MHLTLEGQNEKHTNIYIYSKGRPDPKLTPVYTFSYFDKCNLSFIIMLKNKLVPSFQKDFTFKSRKSLNIVYH